MNDSSPSADFSAGYREFYWRVLAYFLRRGHEESTARDLVSETFMVAWRRQEIGPMELPWLYAVARNTDRQFRRGEARRRALSLRIHTTPATSAPSDPVEVVAVRLALARLPRADREVLLLSEWEDLTAKEIAQVLGCSVSAATVRLHRARRRIKTLLTTHGAGSLSTKVEVFDS